MEIILTESGNKELRIELTKIALSGLLNSRNNQLEIAASDTYAKIAVEIADATMIRLEIK